MVALPSCPFPLEEMLEYVRDGVIAYDADWRFAYVNRAAEAYLGLPGGVVLGKVVWEVFPEVLGTEQEGHLRRARTSNEPIEFELLSPVYQRWTSVRALGSPAGVVVTFHDVTRHRAAEVALRASEERHRVVFENAVAGILLGTDDGRILAANPAACAILRRSEGEILAAGRSGISDSSDPRLDRLIQARRATGKGSGRVTLVRGDGAPFEAEMAVASLPGRGDEHQTVVVFTDVTEQVAGERGLKLLADAGKQLGGLQCREVLASLLGVLVPRVVDMGAAELYRDPRARELVVAHTDRKREDDLRAALLSPAATDAELPGARATAWLPLEAHGKAIGALCVGRLEAGFDEPELMEILREIASRAALALDNALQHEEAIAARRLRDDVLAVVAHDLRSPLNGILLLARSIAKGAPVPNAIDSIIKAAGRAERLIQDLLTAAKLEANAMKMERTMEPASGLAGDLVAQYGPLAEAAGLDLTVDVAPELYLFVDRHRVLQMLGNLIDNALKFTPSGGRVSLRGAIEDGAAVLAVEDSGRGIPAAQLERVFDRFWQGASSRRAGSGLGLAIVKGIAEAHEGSVAVESTLGKGTTFTIHLPLPPEDP